MAEKIIYLVTSGEAGDEYAAVTPEAVLENAALAHALKAQVADGEVYAFPVLDYVPTLVTEHYITIIRTPRGWEIPPDSRGSHKVWDFRVANLAPRVTMDMIPGRITVFHREMVVAREHAEAIVAELTGDGRT